jgi:hypothetical protein
VDALPVAIPFVTRPFPPRLATDERRRTLPFPVALADVLDNALFARMSPLDSSGTSEDRSTLEEAREPTSGSTCSGLIKREGAVS